MALVIKVIEKKFSMIFFCCAHFKNNNYSLKNHQKWKRLFTYAFCNSIRHFV